MPVYRALLRLLPDDFREKWGDDMESLLKDRLARAGKDGVPPLTVWARAFVDVIAVAFRERLGSRHRRTDGEGWMSAFLQDLKHAVRGLGRTPGVTAIAIVTLALGIGANTTTFSVVDTVLLEPLPFPEPERLVSVWPEVNFNVALVREVREGTPALQDVAGISTWTAVLLGAGDPVEIDVGRVSPSFFDILGVPPELGRALQRGEELPDAEPVVVLSHSLWVNRFGGDPAILGRVIALSVDQHDAYTVVGVMPASFSPEPTADAWTALTDDPSLGVGEDSSWFVNDRIARMAPGASLEQAAGQMRVIAERVAPLVPNQIDAEATAEAGVVPMRDDLVADSEGVLWVLLGAVGLVLLIACANVANLLLARGERRRQDLAVRAALGAGRSRIVRLLFAETLVIGGVGGVLGVLTAVALTGAVPAMAPEGIPRMDEVTVDWTVLVFALALTLSATLVAGLWPAVSASRGAALAGLGGAGRAASGKGGSHFVSRGLIAVEVALAIVVSVGSGLMLRSLDNLLSVEKGFDASGVVAFRPNPLGSGRSGAEEFRQFYGALSSQVASVPGVEHVGAVQILTGTSNNWSFPTYPEGYVIPESGAMPDVNFRAVLPGYFEALRVPLLRGRYIEPADREGREQVVVVNQAFVDRFWPGEDGIDKRLSIFSTSGDQLRVVGVVGDMRQHSLSMEPRPELYVPYMAWPWEMSAWFVVRTSEPALLKSELRRVVDAVDPSVPVAPPQDLDVVVAGSAAETRFVALLLTAFGLLALGLGAVGIYGVTSYTVAQRRAEFGVRVALGATRTNVVGSAIRGGLPPIVIGLIVGVALGRGGGGLLQDYLFGVEPVDLGTFALVLLTLSAAALAALTLPAIRAGRVDPVEVLSGE